MNAKGLIILCCASVCCQPLLGQDQVRVSPRQALLQAIEAGDVEKVRESTPRLSNLDGLGRDGRTPLMHAAVKGNAEIVELLIDAGAGIEVSGTPEGYRALHLAAIEGNVDVVRALLGKGADRGAMTADGKTPRDLAAEGGKIEVVTLLESAAGQEQEMAQPVETLDPVQAHRDRLDALLADANEVALHLAKYPDLVQALVDLDEKSKSEKSAWAARRSPTRTRLLAAFEGQIYAELDWVAQIAQAEDANQVVQDANGFKKDWNELLAESEKAMRDARRQAMMGGQQGVAQVQRPTRRSLAKAEEDASQAQPAEPNEAQIQAQAEAAARAEDAGAWSDMSGDNEPLLGRMYDRAVSNLVDLHRVAEQCKANKTLAGIEGLLTMRQARQVAIEAAMAKSRDAMFPGAAGATPDQRGGRTRKR